MLIQSPLVIVDPVIVEFLVIVDRFCRPIVYFSMYFSRNSGITRYSGHFAADGWIHYYERRLYFNFPTTYSNGRPHFKIGNFSAFSTVSLNTTILLLATHLSPYLQVFFSFFNLKQTFSQTLELLKLKSIYFFNFQKVF